MPAFTIDCYRAGVVNPSGKPSGVRNGVTYSCLYQSHTLCEGVRLEGGMAVGECCCHCHRKETRQA